MSTVVERAPAMLRSSCGREIPLRMERWFGEPGPEEVALLAMAIGPALDVGCGPARHVLALTAMGIPAVGIDNAPSVVDIARRRGARVVLGSVFGPLPKEGRWGSALLLDGNFGIGGDPAAALGSRARTRLSRGPHPG